MSNLKPLIFVHPLQDTLKELHKIMVEMAANDGIEVYDIDSITEFNQLFSAVGQSVCIFGNPKKCAQALQANRKVNSKLNSKVLLLTQKSIPRKTLEKFEKIGLTESINEPVAPKTLLYKVRLQLKSIASIEEQEEMSRKFGNEEDKSEANKEVKEKNNLSKENAQTDDMESGKLKGKSGTEDGFTNPEKRKSDYLEEKIDSHMKGKVSGEDQEIDYGKKEKKAYQEEALDQYYKGKSKTSLLVEEDESPLRQEQEDEIDVADLKEALSLELEEELQKEENTKIKRFEEEVERKKKEQKKLDLENEREKNKKNATKVDQISSHMKGSLSSKDQDEEEEKEESKTSSLELSLEDEDHDNSLKLQIDEEELTNRNKSHDLEIDIDSEDLKKSSPSESLGGHLTGMSKAAQKPVDEKQNNEADVEKIETHYKGHFDHQKKDESTKKKDSPSLSLGIKEKPQKNHEKSYQDEDETENGERTNLKLLDQDEVQSKKSKEDGLFDDEEISDKALKANLNLEKNGQDGRSPSGADNEEASHSTENRHTNGEKNRKKVITINRLKMIVNFLHS